MDNIKEIKMLDEVIAPPIQTKPVKQTRKVSTTETSSRSKPDAATRKRQPVKQLTKRPSKQGSKKKRNDDDNDDDSKGDDSFVPRKKPKSESEAPRRSGRARKTRVDLSKVDSDDDSANSGDDNDEEFSDSKDSSSTTSESESSQGSGSSTSMKEKNKTKGSRKPIESSKGTLSRDKTPVRPKALTAKVSRDKTPVNRKLLPRKDINVSTASSTDKKPSVGDLLSPQGSMNPLTPRASGDAVTNTQTCPDSSQNTVKKVQKRPKVRSQRSSTDGPDLSEPLSCATQWNASEVIKDFLYVGAGWCQSNRCLVNRNNDPPQLRAIRMQWARRKNLCYALNMAGSEHQKELHGMKYILDETIYRRIDMNDLDTWEEPMMPKGFESGSEFIELAWKAHKCQVEKNQFATNPANRRTPPTILVHCVAGVNRSPMCVVWWLVRYHGVPLRQAWDLVRRRRDSGANWTGITLGGEAPPESYVPTEEDLVNAQNRRFQHKYDTALASPRDQQINGGLGGEDETTSNIEPSLPTNIPVVDTVKLSHEAETAVSAPVVSDALKPQSEAVVVVSESSSGREPDSEVDVSNKGTSAMPDIAPPEECIPDRAENETRPTTSTVLSQNQNDATITAQAAVISDAEVSSSVPIESSSETVPPAILPISAKPEVAIRNPLERSMSFKDMIISQSSDSESGSRLRSDSVDESLVETDLGESGTFDAGNEKAQSQIRYPKALWFINAQRLLSKYEKKSGINSPIFGPAATSNVIGTGVPPLKLE